MPAKAPKRILLVAEAVTLAHVARPICFAAGLDRDRYRFAIAAARHAAPHVVAAGVEHLELDSIAPARFLEALARGRSLYDASTLERYVQDDLALMERFAPDLVVGDFRLSLSISARLARVPYVSISSAYWSPCYRPLRWPVPALPLTRWLPLRAAQAVFSAARPLAFALHCRPLNRVRARHGLPGLPLDLRSIYTDADHVAYSDLPELFPLAGQPASHHFLGPALWQPATELPAWWAELPEERPCVYITLGSSGDASLLPIVVSALAPLPVSLLVAHAGAAPMHQPPPNVWQAAYLPGLEAARRARLVVCNGGSLTAYQGLAGGAAVIGIAGNLDQFLNMQAFERLGLGATLRSDRVTADSLRSTAQRLLARIGGSAAARELRHRCGEQPFGREAAALVGRLIG